MGTALLIIDVQQAWCVGEHAAFEARRVMGTIKTVPCRRRRSRHTTPHHTTPHHTIT